MASSAAATLKVDSLAALAEAAAGNDREIEMTPGVYRMADYLTEEVLKRIRDEVGPIKGRPPVPMFVFRGDKNRISMQGVTIEIDTSLYEKLPQGGYTRCLIVAGRDNTIDSLTIRNTGPNRGSGGNILSVQGDDNTLENVTLHIHGSQPWGYGDLLGKGGPNLVALEKQSGVQVIGSHSLLRRCRVFSRAFGHCFYIQGGEGSRLEDCYAEGSVRLTTDMLTDTSGPAFELGFRSVYKNRDGRFVITPGYTKSLSEDGFRTYGNAGSVTLLNCTAINTRAGFEIGVRDESETKTVVENCVARGCERGFLIGSQTIIRRCRGDVAHGPLLYLRGGHSSEVELELIGDPPRSLVHVLATIAGEHHKVRLSAQRGFESFPALPILVGFGMPMHAEMASEPLPALARDVDLESTINFAPIFVGAEVRDSKIETTGRRFEDDDLRKDPGPW
ncbi:hypothetical protein HNR46_003711 [Haloferula luteola]|uniref:Right handed beta helix domain-containing protein n=1 Tax=Haloferula luteola TaxID=595692 RepID=A0A840VHZ1_9BACT|nr:hypothetical protein [Haloferula luteola]MBB5353450.1 hypothetical protein [Haloferula luteola]